MLLDKLTETNIINSVTLYLAEKLLAASYLVYYHKTDAVQISSTDFYLEYSKNRDSYLIDPTFSAAYTTAKGLVTVLEAIPAEPRFVTRLIEDASVGPQDEVPVPAASIEMDAADPVRLYELGSIAKWRSRHLIIDVFVRTMDEQRLFKDLLSSVFDPNVNIEIKDHDAGDLTVVGSVEVLDTSVVNARIVDSAEAVAFEVLLNTRLEYVA